MRYHKQNLIKRPKHIPRFCLIRNSKIPLDDHFTVVDFPAFVPFLTTTRNKGSHLLSSLEYIEKWYHPIQDLGDAGGSQLSNPWAIGKETQANSKVRIMRSNFVVYKEIEALRYDLRGKWWTWMMDPMTKINEEIDIDS